MAPSLHGAAVHPGEGKGVSVDGGCHQEKLPETLPCLNSPGTTSDHPTWTAPGPGPYRTTNKLKLCHISNFLLALLPLLELLIVSAQCAGYDFQICLSAHYMISTVHTSK